MSRRALVRVVVTAVTAVTAASACCGLIVHAAGAKTLTLPELPIPVHVVFNGSGQFHYNNSEGSDAVADDKLDWDVEYRAELQPDGTLTSVSTPPLTTAGTYTFTDDFYEVACSGSIPTVPQAGPFPPGTPNPPPETTPAPQADGLVIQGITYLSTDPGRFSDCVGARDDFDGSGEAADGVGTVLNQSLPGALAARIPQVPRQGFLAGGVALRTIAVSYADAPTQIPASCADLFGIDDPAKCTESLSWSGTVLLDATAGCPLILAGPSLVCMPPSGTPLAAFTQGVETDAAGPGTASVSVTAAGAGGPHAAAIGAHAAATHRLVIASASVKVTHAGRVRLRPRLTAAGTTLFRHSRRVKVTIQIVFEPKSGRAHTSRLTTVLLR